MKVFSMTFLYKIENLTLLFNFVFCKLKFVRWGYLEIRYRDCPPSFLKEKSSPINIDEHRGWRGHKTGPPAPENIQKLVNKNGRIYTKECTSPHWNCIQYNEPPTHKFWKKHSILSPWIFNLCSSFSRK